MLPEWRLFTLLPRLFCDYGKARDFKCLSFHLPTIVYALPRKAKLKYVYFKRLYQAYSYLNIKEVSSRSYSHQNLHDPAPIALPLCRQ